MVNLRWGFTMLQQNNTHREQQWAQQQNDINQRLTSLEQAIPPHSTQTRAAVVLAPSSAALEALQANQSLEESNAAGLPPWPSPANGNQAQAPERNAQPTRAGGLEPQGSPGPSKGPTDPSHSIKWQEWGDIFSMSTETPHTSRIERKSP
jgi:hypothetical protein